MLATLRTAVAISLVSALPSLASDAMPLPADATPVEAAAYDMLEKHCARCHQDGALGAGLTKPKSGFGHVLDLRRLAQDTKFVSQGDAAGSKLYSVIGEYSFPRMPDDCTDAACFPTVAELDALEAWIDVLDDEPETRTPVSLAELYALAHADLQTQPTNRQGRIRYLSLRTMHNDPDVSAENLEGYKAATIKLINALSWNPTVFRAEEVDPHGVLIRIFLPEVNWTEDTWYLLESVYPYGMTSQTDTHLMQLQQLAGTRIPVIRADWFASRASVSPLYYDILDLPDTAQGLEAMLGVDVVANIRNEQVVRAGFQDSGVSTHNRLIERHALGTGFFWTSYDFAGSAERQSFFEYPLGPVRAYGEELAFHHDGGESIFTLPNGFHAYYLNTADGARLNVGPTSIVRDDDYTDGTGEVVNGISCISCHSRGIRLNEDKVRDVAMADLSLPPEVRQTIEAIYPGQDEVAKWLAADEAAFVETLRSAGIDPEIKAGGLEPVRGLFVYHVDLFVDFEQAANELGLTPEGLRQRAGFVGPELASLILRLDQSPIARDEWTAAYPLILERVTDYRHVTTTHQPDEDLSYSVRRAVGSYTAPPTDYTPPPSHGAAPPAGDYAATDTADYRPGDHSIPTRGHLTVYFDKPAYTVGEGLKIIVEPRHDCRLTLINIDDRRRSCVLYPHPQLPDTPVAGGSQFVFPPRGSLRTTEPGVETILAICNGSRDAVAAEYRDTSQVSCDVANQGEIAYHDVVREVLSLDLDDAQSDNGIDYRALSTHNPHVAKATVSALVTAQ